MKDKVRWSRAEMDKCSRLSESGKQRVEVIYMTRQKEVFCVQYFIKVFLPAAFREELKPKVLKLLRVRAARR